MNRQKLRLPYHREQIYFPTFGNYQPQPQSHKRVDLVDFHNYENQQGQRVYVTEVVADSFQMLESRSARDGMGGGASAGSYSAPSQSTNNTPRPQTNNNSATPNFGRDADPLSLIHI